jgi:uncharacterized damage-inducible protein DinB
MSRPLLADAFSHHIWATGRLIDACIALDPAQLETTAQGTYGTILDTMRHLVAADRGYLFSLTDGRVTEIEEATMDLAALRAVIEGSGSEWVALVATDIDPDADVVRHRDDGTDSHAPAGVRYAQALHHGTDHRSQICTMLTALGVEPPEIDVWDYADQDGRLSVTFIAP